MSELARLSRVERAEVINEAAVRLGISPLILEKDFWVSWTLGVLFSDEAIGPHVVFKGGTSLSMVYGAIARFSEDIDLALSPSLFGVSEVDLNEAPSSSQRRKRMEALSAACAEHVEHVLRPRLGAGIAAKLGARAMSPDTLVYQYDKAIGSPDVLFRYPSAIDTQDGYIRKQVKLEFGSLTNQRPTGSHRIAPLLARVIAGEYDDFESSVVALEIERTFWEKATILHSEAHRPLDKPLRDRTARHYSDFAALWAHPSRPAALARFDLLGDVALHKQRFFTTSWANYGAAKPGTLRLVPPAERQHALKLDYDRMRPMFLEAPLPFADVLARLAEAEREINAS